MLSPPSGVDELESTFAHLQKEISTCSFICEEIHERSIRSLLYAKQVLDSRLEINDQFTRNVDVNAQHDGAVLERTCMIEKMFCDLEMFHWVYAELESTSKQQFSCADRYTPQCTNKTSQFKETLSNPKHFGLVDFHQCLTRAETKIKAAMQDLFAKTKTKDRRCNVKSLTGFNFWNRIKVNLERELDNAKAQTTTSPEFICWVFIRHNDSGKFLSATSGKVSLTASLDSEKCLFGLHALPNTNILTGILTRQRQIKIKKQRKLKRMNSVKRAVPFSWAKVCNKIEDAIEADYDNDLPSSIDGKESVAVVGFRQRSTGMWLGERSVVGLSGGDVVCESAVYGERQEWEINDLCRDETTLLSVNANRGGGGFVEVVDENQGSCKIGKKGDEIAIRMASVWSLKELCV
ncbi:hypothetical protein ACHAXS_005440 [Conticribra weissflogii]